VAGGITGGRVMYIEAAKGSTMDNGFTPAFLNMGRTDPINNNNNNNNNLLQMGCHPVAVIILHV
jgi:hypothetical protein